jgi:AraC family transcriptional regulator
MNLKVARNLGRFVGLDQPRTLTTRYLQVAEIIGARVNWTQTDAHTPVRMETTDGYLLCLQRRYLPSYHYWVNGQPAPAMPLRRGQFLFLDLNEEHASVTKGAVDCVSMYASRAALRRFQDEHDLRSVELRTASGVAFSDPVISNLGECLVPAFERPDTVSQLLIDHVALALLTHLTEYYADEPAVLRPISRGLGRWQERRAKEMLLASADGRLRLEELARECGLSRAQFSRSFKASVGMSPFQWQCAQRVEQAKHLLSSTDLSIDRIGAACGFLNESQFTREFRKATGAAPSVWRRVVRS